MMGKELGPITQSSTDIKVTVPFIKGFTTCQGIQLVSK